MARANANKQLGRLATLIFGGCLAQACAKAEPAKQGAADSRPASPVVVPDTAPEPPTPAELLEIAGRPDVIARGHQLWKDYYAEQCAEQLRVIELFDVEHAPLLAEILARAVADGRGPSAREAARISYGLEQSGYPPKTVAALRAFVSTDFPNRSYSGGLTHRALYQLGQRGGPKDWALLTLMVQDKARPEHRLGAIRSLGKGARNVPELMKALETVYADVENPWVMRHAAYFALAQAGTWPVDNLQGRENCLVSPRHELGELPHWLPVAEWRVAHLPTQQSFQASGALPWPLPDPTIPPEMQTEVSGGKALFAPGVTIAQVVRHKSGWVVGVAPEDGEGGEIWWGVPGKEWTKVAAVPFFRFLEVGAEAHAVLGGRSFPPALSVSGASVVRLDLRPDGTASLHHVLSLPGVVEATWQDADGVAIFGEDVLAMIPAAGGPIRTRCGEDPVSFRDARDRAHVYWGDSGVATQACLRAIPTWDAATEGVDPRCRLRGSPAPSVILDYQIREKGVVLSTTRVPDGGPVVEEAYACIEAHAPEWTLRRGRGERGSVTLALKPYEAAVDLKKAWEIERAAALKQSASPKHP